MDVYNHDESNYVDTKDAHLSCNMFETPEDLLNDTFSAFLMHVITFSCHKMPGATDQTAPTTVTHCEWKRATCFPLLTGGKMWVRICVIFQNSGN